MSSPVPFYADLHIHSKYSRATSKDCDLEHLSLWAQRKGITVVGSGDFTHPAWIAEIKERLIPAEPGLFRLRPELEREVERQVEASCRRAIRFTLSVEISTIYKKGDRTRKVHHVIFAPDVASAERFIERLSHIGNITSDGRPILGLDSRDLLEIVLESGDGCYLVPAHIWTPWFSVLGSKSGFDSIEECYGDLADHIFAVETGLSSDPPMNWRLSALDRYRLVSNSDAHSPSKLGREANLFSCDVDYFAMRNALETGAGFGGTVEFFPEEGKYHLDGHRRCGVCLDPEETRRHGGKCPSCGRDVTVGVMHRVEVLADRPEGTKPAHGDDFRSLIPLCEVLGEIEGVGPKSKRVARLYDGLVSRLGPELEILERMPLEEIRAAGPVLLADALERMRAGDVVRAAGYDGEYGVIRLFEPDEIARRRGSGLLFALEAAARAQPDDAPWGGEDSASRPEPRAPAAAPPPVSPAAATTTKSDASGDTLLDGLDPEQRAAAEIVEGPLLIVAGPGTGKTRTLTHRVAHLIHDLGVAPEACLTITFTRRAAAELRERLEQLVPAQAARAPVHTFHSLGLSLLRDAPEAHDLPADFAVADQTTQIELVADALGIGARDAGRTLQKISEAKRTRATPEGELGAALEAYCSAMCARGLVDFDDLLGLPCARLERDAAVRDELRARFSHVSIDEYQDIDPQQYTLVRQLSADGGNLCAIGDPDQAIYRFRGADVALFDRFEQDHPGARVVRLRRCYRLGENILDACAQVIEASPAATRRFEALLDAPGRIVFHEAETERAEAEHIVKRLEELLGGHSFFSLDTGRSAGNAAPSLAFGDFALLYRTEAQADALVEALQRSGIPFQRRSHHRLLDRVEVRELLDELRAAPARGALSSRLGALVSDEATSSARAAAAALLEPYAARCGDDLGCMLDQLALGAEVDLWDPRAERVSLLTLHAAKGLEFPVVFIVGCEDGLLPLRFGDALEEEALAEERRLFYVGVTRAARSLYLSRAHKRRWRGEVRELAPSPFLLDIAERLLERHVASPRKRTARSPQMDLF